MPNKDPLPRFAWSRAPIAGESLLGFVARNADIHGVYGVAAALRPAGLSGATTDYLATSHADKAEAIAYLFGTTAEEVRTRMYLPVDVNETLGEFVSFFGSPVRTALLGFGRRRVSPHSLSRSEHHRAVWDLKVLSFCPESRHELISTCPACQRPLGWRLTLGVGACEFCGKDLTKAEGIPVRCDDVEALDFVADLLCPDRGTRERACGRVSAQVAALAPWEVFELVLALARAILTPPDLSRLFTPKSYEDFSRLTPDVLAEAGRVVLDWPIGLHRLASKVRARAMERPGFWGVRKELAPLLLASRVSYLPPPVQQSLRATLDTDMGSASLAPRRARQRTGSDLITVSQASKEFGIHLATLRRLRATGTIWSSDNPKANKSIALVKRAEIVEMVDARRDAVSRFDVTKMLGVDYLAVERLAQAGHFEKLTPPAADLLVGDNYRRSSVDAFVARMIAKADRSRAEARLGSHLISAALMQRTEVVPWVSIVSSVLSGVVCVRRASCDATPPLMASLYVRSLTTLSEAVADMPPEALPCLDGRRLNTHEAAAMLEVTAPTLSTFIATGLLPSQTDVPLKLDGGDVGRFRSLYALTPELSRRFARTQPEARSILRARGVSLVVKALAGKHLVWDRRGAERVLGAGGQGA